MLTMRFRQCPEGLRHIWVLLLPEAVSAVRCLRPQANHARALCIQPEFDRVAIPAKYPLCPAGTAPAIFQRHRRLKGAAFRSEHFRTCQSQVFYLGRAQGHNCRGGGEQHDQAQWLNKWKPHYTLMGIAFFGNHLKVSLSPNQVQGFLHNLFKNLALKN
ncbi:hypothetical protein [Nitrosomonas sp. Nm34]|uniref:hypothetical protein n=1 Tax=Nitrosomonas sp. Nm34 TaxID=1881055 RepID=UPI0020C86E84|nr:hypothetical protein [Nitrosomonas sp. Nm34]